MILGEISPHRPDPQPPGTSPVGLAHAMRADPVSRRRGTAPGNASAARHAIHR